MKPIKIRGSVINKSGQPLICVPLVARHQDALLAALNSVLPKQPDIIEWRVDFFEAIHHIEQVVATAQALRKAAGLIPIIFTRRAMHEGGEAILVDEAHVLSMYEAVIASGAVDIIDYELSQPSAHRARLRAATRQHAVLMMLSYHHFTATPTLAALVAKMAEAAAEAADIAKVAVMPQRPADVLVLLEATMLASTQLEIPIVTMSMGSLGAITRLSGWMFGSAMTFAAGTSQSAPGQMPIDALRAAMATMRDATG